MMVTFLSHELLTVIKYLHDIVHFFLLALKAKNTFWLFRKKGNILRTPAPGLDHWWLSGLQCTLSDL